MRLSERGKTMLTFGLLSAALLSFEFALLANAEPLAPAGPIAAVLDRGLDGVRASAHGAPGMSVAIVRDGAIAYEYSGGYADVANGKRVTPETRFRAGSITKMFTAISIMQLAEAGRLGLDDTVAKYLPAAPHADRITVRQLLSQTSGLTNFTDMAFSSGQVTKPTTPDDILAPIASQPLDFVPGTKYEYSNTNYVILGRIVEAVDGSPLAEIERQRILAPAGMTQTSFGTVPSDVPVAIGYDDVAGNKPTAPYDTSWLYGAGDVITTAADLARFDIALMSGKLVSPAALATMQTPLNAMESRESYGLGFMVAPLGTRTIAGHHGGIPGFESDDEMITKAHFAVIALGNNSTFYTSGVNNISIAALLPTDFALAEAGALHGIAADRAALDPAIEAKLRGFLRGISANDIDRATLTREMDAALTPAAVAGLATKLPAYSSLRSLALETTATQGSSRIYYFSAAYTDSTLTYQIVFDEAGKIGGFFLR